MKTEPVNLVKITADAAVYRGVIWTPESEDLNANLVCFSGEGVGGHTNDGVGVLLLGVAGSGVVNVDGWEQELRDGTLG